MLAAIALAAALPTISITVHASPDVSPRLIKWVVDEADDIWRGAGVRIAWTLESRDGTVPATRSLEDPLRVVIDHERGTRLGGEVALGWVVFEGDRPRPEIHLSYANAVAGVERIAPRAMLNMLARMRVDELVATALGRALAHELGHYLLELKNHSEDDALMHASWTAEELFGAEPPRLRLNAAERRALASKLSPALLTKR